MTVKLEKLDRIASIPYETAHVVVYFGYPLLPGRVVPERQLLDALAGEDKWVGSSPQPLHSPQ